MKIQLDGTRMTSRPETHTYLQEMLGFPVYYGKNLDALYDCLSESGKMEITFLHTAEMLAALGKYGENLLKVFQDAENILFITEE